ncbi:hypothetical protein [Agromyces sp. NPDC058104]|uniref:golvesin C-terminal-like domain-containing protein n=1 Tax=Agromyces sp. NPDC058104 TaxID=3346342 RepID=UPI0036DF8836
MTTANDIESMTVPDAVEVIIDNLDAELTGTWLVSSFQPNFYGSNYHYANRSAVSTEPRVARWRPSIPRAGEFEVFVWLPDGKPDRSQAVKYRVHHDGEISEFLIDQTEPGGKWRRLGDSTLSFSGSGDEFVELRMSDVPVKQGFAVYVHVDAVRVATPPPPPSEAPGDLQVKTGRNWVEVWWSAVDDADRYNVSRSVDGGEPEEYEATGRAFLDLDLKPGSTAQYRIRAANASGVGPESQVVEGRCRTGAPLQAVQGLTISSENGRPRLQWNASRDARGYRIERTNRSGGNLKVIAEVGADATSFTDTASPDRAHYVVRSVNEHGPAVLGSWQVNWKR